MRAAVLHLAFAGLGVQHAVSPASDNAAALEVSRKLGYREDGIERHAVRAKPAVLRRLRLITEQCHQHQLLPVKVEELPERLAWFGLALRTAGRPRGSTVGACCTPEIHLWPQALRRGRHSRPANWEPAHPPLRPPRGFATSVSRYCQHYWPDRAYSAKGQYFIATLYLLAGNLSGSRGRTELQPGGREPFTGGRNPTLA